jgi:NMD protein affecting ribosome stability and mRNA decay
MKAHERAVARVMRREQSANDERYGDDPYRASARPPEPTVCPECKAVFAEGRWAWDPPPEEAFRQLCPACQRIHDKFPAGYVTIKGEFFKAHRDEIVTMIQKHEKKEKSQKPLLRIIDIDEKRDGVEITTTDSLLARGIAEALQSAYKGDLKLRYSRDENLLRAVWRK